MIIQGPEKQAEEVKESTKMVGDRLATLEKDIHVTKCDFEKARQEVGRMQRQMEKEVGRVRREMEEEAERLQKEMEEVEGRIQTTVAAEVKKTIHVQLKEKWGREGVDVIHAYLKSGFFFLFSVSSCSRLSLIVPCGSDFV